MSNRQTLSGIAAAATLVTAGVVPITAAPAISTDIVATVSRDIALVSNAIVDDLAAAASAVDVPPAAVDLPDAAAAFDFSGLLNAEVAALEGLFNTVIALPGTLISDVENLFTDLGALNFGMAFSALASIPQDIVNYLIAVPVAIGNTLYDMALVIPGEFLFNFGA